MAKRIKKLIAGEDGYIFAVTLILLMLGALLLPHLLSFMITGIDSSQVYEDEMYQLYAADAGVEDAFWKLNNDLPSSYPHSYQITDNINNNTVAVTIEQVGIAYKITSIAIMDSSSSTMIESYVVPIFSIVDFAAASLNGDLTIKGTATIDSEPEPDEANIYANGDINLNGNVEVFGDAVATGSINMVGGAYISGDTLPNSPEVEIIGPDVSQYWDEVKDLEPIEGDLNINEDIYLGSTYIIGDLSITSDAVVTIGGTIWVDGAISMTGSSHVEGGGTLVAVGDISVLGGGELEPEDYPFIFSTEGNIETGGVDRVYAVLYAPNGNVKIAGTSGINGAAIGATVEILTSCTLSYPWELREYDPEEALLKIVSWEIN